MKPGEVFELDGHTLKAVEADIHEGCAGCVGDPPMNGRRIGEATVRCGNLPQCADLMNDGINLKFVMYHEVRGGP